MRIPEDFHRAKSRVSVFLKRGGNMQLHVSVMFTFWGNVKNASLRDSVTFPERKCQVTFPSYLSHQISAVVRFRHLQTDLQLFATFTKTQTRDGSLNSNILTSRRRTTAAAAGSTSPHTL